MTPSTPTPPAEADRIEPKLKDIRITICDACLDGIGQECHTPGCALWLHRVDLPIDPRLYEVLDEAAQRPAAPVDRETLVSIIGDEIKRWDGHDAIRHCVADAILAHLSAQPRVAVPEESAAVRDVLAERRRQVEVEGWTPEHDDAHTVGELLDAAFCYLENAGNSDVPPTRWPWDKSFWKPKDIRRDLVRGCALIVAEIERLDRAPQPTTDAGSAER